MSKPATRTSALCIATILLVVLATSLLPTASTAHGAAGNAETSAKIIHLLNRAGYGPRPEDVERVRSKGLSQYIEEQLRPEQIDDSATDRLLAQFETLTMDPATLWQRYSRNPNPILDQLQMQKVLRAIHSERQLQEVMVDFWFNHFNVYWAKDDVRFLTTSYELDAIRRHALGKFGDLLLATARHPAMLLYLDNAVSGSPDINENYARELMELHTIGVDGGYTQQDVEEVARVFTGWTVDREDPAYPFVFNPAMHKAGDKKVLGHPIAAGGYDEGVKTLGLLVRHPSTAQFIATKLVRRFVADDPPAELVQEVARIFSETDGDIRRMVRTILTSAEFYDSDVYRAKAKSPLELLASSIRAVDAEILATLSSQEVLANLRGVPANSIEVGKSGLGRLRSNPAIILVDTIRDMGQMPYQYSEPTGHPDRGDYWMSGWSLLGRLDFAAKLVEGRMLGTKVNLSRLTRHYEMQPAGQEPWKRALNVVTGLEGTPGLEMPASPEEVLHAYTLALGSPGFQHK